MKTLALPGSSLASEHLSELEADVRDCALEGLIQWLGNLGREFEYAAEKITFDNGESDGAGEPRFLRLSRSVFEREPVSDVGLVQLGCFAKTGETLWIAEVPHGVG